MARKRHPCDGFGCDGIRAGDLYVECVAPPGWDDLGNTGWWRLRYCVKHAQQYDTPRAALADRARVAELADALDLGSSGLGRAGSSPASRK